MEPEEETLPYVIERIGDDKIVFASDYPHWDGMFPHVTSTIRGRKDISEQAKNNVLGRKRQAAFTAGTIRCGLGCSVSLFLALSASGCRRLRAYAADARRLRKMRMAFTSLSSVDVPALDRPRSRDFQ